MDFPRVWGTRVDASLPRRRWSGAGRRIGSRLSRADRASLLILEAPVRSRILTFAAAQEHVARHVIERTDMWANHIQGTTNFDRVDPLLPELWEALQMERRLIAGMSDFHLGAPSAPLARAWVSALHAEVELNHAMSDLHIALAMDGSQALDSLKAVETAAQSALTEAELLRVTAPS